MSSFEKTVTEHPAAPRISIALATFNGIRFLREQLQSLSGQTWLPCELVVADDGSSDGTQAELERFVKVAPFPVRVLPAQSRQGSTRAFERAIYTCGGDVIALCDQDDRWHLEKLQRFANALEAEPAAGWVFSDGHVMDLAGQDPAGCAIRHDAWMISLVEAVAPSVAIKQPLMSYRVHSGQEIGLREAGMNGRMRNGLKRAFTAKRTGPAADLHRRLAAIELLRTRLSEHLDSVRARASLCQLDKLRTHLHARASIARARLPGRIARASAEWRLGHYQRYSSGIYSAAADVLRR
ncbi:MAG: glycosyltransferase [Actinobacteria bacterium]|nr:MAG: glycosyltransferase [Actinomycetota bacterium]